MNKNMDVLAEIRNIKKGIYRGLLALNECSEDVDALLEQLKDVKIDLMEKEGNSLVPKIYNQSLKASSDQDAGSARVNLTWELVEKPEVPYGCYYVTAHRDFFVISDKVGMVGLIFSEKTYHDICNNNDNVSFVTFLEDDRVISKVGTRSGTDRVKSLEDNTISIINEIYSQFGLESTEEYSICM